MTKERGFFEVLVPLLSMFMVIFVGLNLSVAFASEGNNSDISTYEAVMPMATWGQIARQTRIAPGVGEILGQDTRSVVHGARAGGNWQ